MRIDRKRIYLTLYRIVGIIGVFGITSIFFFYGITFLFFVQNKTWVAPTVITATDERALQAQAAFVFQEKTRQELTVKADQERASIKVLQDALSQQYALLRQYNEAVKEFQHAANRQTKANVSIDTNRANVIADLTSIQKDLRQYLKTNDDMLAAGLITKDQHTQTKAQIFSLDASLVDVRQQGNDIWVQTDMLTRQIQTLAGNSGKDITAVDVLNRRAAVIAQIGQLTVTLATTQQALIADEISLKNISAEMNLFNKSINGKVIRQSKVNLAFVPYENNKNVHTGDPVYSCAAVFFWCSRVGTIGQKFDEEQRVDFPVLNLRFTHVVRGFYVEFNIDKGKERSIEDLIVFVGSKPLFL